MEGFISMTVREGICGRVIEICLLAACKEKEVVCIKIFVVCIKIFVDDVGRDGQPLPGIACQRWEGWATFARNCMSAVTGSEQHEKERMEAANLKKRA